MTNSTKNSQSSNSGKKADFKPVIIVTGASSGLGEALALEADSRKARIALLARREDQLKKIQGELLSEGCEAVPVKTDIRDAESVCTAVDQVVSLWGRIDILFNNAGIVEPVRPLLNTNGEELQSALLTNVFGVYIATRECLKQMLLQPDGGTIINVTSGAAVKPYVGWAAYGGSKAAVNAFTRIVALEVQNKPVRVAALSPGPFESNMQQILRKSEAENFPSRQKFVDLWESGNLPEAKQIEKIFLDIALSDWPELSGKVADIRSEDFRVECRNNGISI